MAKKENKMDSFVTRSEIKSLERGMKDGFKTLGDKIDSVNSCLVKPPDGLFFVVDNNKGGIKRAHERIDEFSKDIKGIQISLNGDPNNGNKGIKRNLDDIAERIESLEKSRNLYMKLLWKVVTPILSALGVGIVYLIFRFLPRIDNAMQLLKSTGH